MILQPNHCQAQPIDTKIHSICPLWKCHHNHIVIVEIFTEYLSTLQPTTAWKLFPQVWGTLTRNYKNLCAHSITVSMPALQKKWCCFCLHLSRHYKCSHKARQKAHSNSLDFWLKPKPKPIHRIYIHLKHSSTSLQFT